MLHFLFYLHSGGSLDNLTADRRAAPRTRASTAARRRSRCGWRPSSATRSGSAAPVLRDRAGRARASSLARRLGRARGRSAPSSRSPPAVIPRISFAPAAQRPPRAPPREDAARLRDQVPWPATSARSGATRASPARPASTERPLAITFDNSPARRLLRRAARLPRGRPRPPRRRAHAREPPRRSSSATSPPTSARRPLEPLEYVEQDWAEEEWIRGGYGAHLGARDLDRLRPAPARARGPGPLGRAPRRAPSGTATWTARSARASGSRRRSPPRAQRRAIHRATGSDSANMLALLTPVG